MTTSELAARSSQDQENFSTKERKRRLNAFRGQGRGTGSKSESSRVDPIHRRLMGSLPLCRKDWRILNSLGRRIPDDSDVFKPIKYILHNLTFVIFPFYVIYIFVSGKFPIEDRRMVSISLIYSILLSYYLLAYRENESKEHTIQQVV